MSPGEILNALKERDVQLWLEGGRLQFHGPKGAMTSELRGEVADKKDELIALLRDRLSEQTNSFPLSYGQRALWFLHENNPNNTAYHVAFTARIRSEIHVPSLKLALQALLDRHEALRTTFTAQDGTPVQNVHGYRDLSLECASVSGEEIEDIHELISERYQRPFDLKSGPIFRAHLLTRGERDHFLLIVIHHIVIDGWSYSILLGELVALYEAQTTGKPAALPRKNSQYEGYVRRQDELLSGPDGERLFDYWENYLAGNLPNLDLPTDRPRPRMQRYQGATHGFSMGPAITRRINELAKATSATPYMVLLAGFQTLLSRHTGQQEILVGTPSYGRNRPELNDIVGYFVNMLVQRGDLSDDPTFETLVRRVRESTLAAIDNQDLPFPALVERLNPRRDMSRSPIFQACFVMHNILHGERMQAFQISDDLELTESFGGLELSPFPIAQMEGQFDLTLELIEWEDELTGCFKYNTDLFGPATISRLVGHFQILLEGIVAAPETRIGELPLLLPDERERLLNEFNATAADYPRESRLHDLIAAQVERTPDAIALEFEDERMSYRELDDQANDVAYRLRGLGIEPEALVAVCLDRSAGLVVALLGVLKAGCAYLPLDPDFPPQRIGFILEDAAVACLVTESSVRDRLPEAEAPRLMLDEAGEMVRGPLASGTPEDLAYVIYTSGSTGKPKGVQVTHGNIVNLLTSCAKEPGFSAEDTMLTVTTPSFDISVFEIFLPLIVGGRLVVARSDDVTSADRLKALLTEKGISVMFATPGIWRMLVDSGWAGNVQLTAQTGGEALPQELAKRVAQIVGSFWNLYGPTETTIMSTAYRFESPMDPVYIGRPIANTQLYVLDGNGQLCPMGVPGELYIGGEGVTRGYLNRPELTAERFVMDPYSSVAGARLYRTGDLVRYRDNGMLEYLQRLDDQVKVRGFRIELGEIESVLVEHAAVNGAVVVAREMGAGDNRLVAYIVSVEDGMDAAELRGYLRERLPDYMIPQYFMALDSFPLTPNGKVDRNALPEPGVELSRQAYVAPHTPIEQRIASIWEAVLKTERVGIHDNFFDIGGHSLLATAVVARLRDELGTSLELRRLFEAPTVAELAQLIDGGGEVERSQMPALVKSTDSGPVPQSYAQQRLWYLDQFEPHSAVYNISTALRLSGELDVDALRQALNEVVRRHEVLRTTLVGGEGEDGLVQQVAEQLELEVLLEELTIAADEDAASAARRVLEETSAQPFDLALGPLIRVRLLRLADQEHVLLVVMHHAISDGWSLEVFLKEVRELYVAFHQGLSSPLAPLPVQYGDYARWQRHWLEGGELERQLEYWLDKFPTEPPALNMPTDRARPAVQGYRGAAVRFELSGELVASLERLGRSEGATLFMVLLAAYKVLLARYTGQESLSVGTPIANRPLSQLESLIGFFVNTLVMSTDLSGNPSFRETLQRVQETCLGAYSHQDIPFERLVEAVNPARDLSRTPLFQTLFSYQDMSTVSLEMDEVVLDPFDLPVKVSRTDLTLWLIRGLQDGLEGLLEYNTDLFDPQTMAGFIERFQVLLEGIVAAPGTRIGELPLLLPDERERLVHEWNATAADYPRELRLHDLIAVQVERSPDVIALEFEDESLSYRELDDRANDVAYRLRGLGIEPEALVGVCLDRSAGLVVVLLGVLKAGCANLPLDPDFPPQRLGFILEDAAVACLVTESSVRDRLPEMGVSLLVLDEAGEMVRGPLASGTPEDLAYVIYTSGSTGKPKGVQVPHGTVVNLLSSVAREPGFSAEDTMLAVTTPAFDISVLEIFLPLMVGGRLVVASSDDVTSADRLKGLLAEKGISKMQATPSTWRMLIDSGWTGAAHLKALCGGEALPQELATRLAERVGSLWNLYGPTETTIWSSAYRFASPADPVCIGRPIANTQLYVLDGNGQLCPIGVPGELYIGGDGVTCGYLNRPELTEERFVTDPFSSVDGARMYRTGDLVRYRADGMLEYLQRLDDQVKVRGYRIELGEIEAILGEHASVGSAVVVAHEMGAGDTRLVAYWVGEESSVVTGTGLRAYLRERLPPYMVPQHFIELDSFPLTPNGKVDRAALPEIFASPETDSYVAPSTQSEQRMASIWEAVLKKERIGIHDNFFEIGGHSLLAIKLVERMKTEFGAEVNLFSLMTNSLGQIASDLEDAVGEMADSKGEQMDWGATTSRLIKKLRLSRKRS